MSTDADELRRVRARLAALEGADWQLCCDGDVSFVEAKTRDGDLNKIATFHAGATFDEIEFIVGAPRMAAFMLDLVDRAIVAMRHSSPKSKQKRKPYDFARDAAIKCGEPAFKVFLEECHGLERPLTTERVTERLRTILNIKSRKELNESGAAAERWRDLRAAFETWKRVG
nr:hypothetical protein [Brucella anthropi]